MTNATGMLKHTVCICPIKVTVMCFSFNWRNQSDLEITEFPPQSFGELLQM